MDKNKEQIIIPGLYLVSTPIGNMEDITLRALNVLKKSDIILCEDTRRSGKLLSHFQIEAKLLPYHKFNEKKVSNKIINSIKKNKVISLITDAGTPTISDPGMILVNTCIEENLSICPIPGSSAVTSAVSVSGFGDQYLFYGFLPKKENELESALKSLCNLDYSIVLFISALKINFYISKFKKYFFDRKIVIAREMTKLHEEFIRDKVKSMKNLSEGLKGEFTVVLSEKIKEKNIKKEINESVKIKIKKMLKKYSHKDVVEFISKKENLPKKMTGEIEKITKYRERKKDLERRIKILEKSNLYKDKNELKKLEQMHTLGKVNFDSVVVIDFGERLKSILTSFMFFDVSSNEVNFFTINQWFDETFFNENAMQNLYFPSIDYKNFKKFNKKFLKTYNEKPSKVSILGYDALGLIYYCWFNNNFQFKQNQLYNKKGFKALHGEFIIEDNLSKQKLNIYKVSEKKFIKVY